MATRKKKPTGDWRCRCGFACVGSEKRCANCLTDRPDASAPKAPNEWEEMQKMIDAQGRAIRSIEVILDVLLRSLPRAAQIRLTMEMGKKKKTG